jgi:hypothetical protein
MKASDFIHNSLFSIRYSPFPFDQDSPIRSAPDTITGAAFFPSTASWSFAMAKRKRHAHGGDPKHGRKGPANRAKAASEAIQLRAVPGSPGEFELVFPPSIRQRAEDLEEVHTMLEAGEYDVAEDELRWLLSGCGILLEAHKLLGEIALEFDDFTLARTHLGYAYELGLEALPADFSGKLPYNRPSNRPFLEAGRLLAECLGGQGEHAMADDVLARVLSLDPSDPMRPQGGCGGCGSQS